MFHVKHHANIGSSLMDLRVEGLHSRVTRADSGEGLMQTATGILYGVARETEVLDRQAVATQPAIGEIPEYCSPVCSSRTPKLANKGCLCSTTAALLDLGQSRDSGVPRETVVGDAARRSCPP